MCRFPQCMLGSRTARALAHVCVARGNYPDPLQVPPHSLVSARIPTGRESIVTSPGGPRFLRWHLQFAPFQPGPGYRANATNQGPLEQWETSPVTNPPNAVKNPPPRFLGPFVSFLAN